MIKMENEANRLFKDLMPTVPSNLLGNHNAFAIETAEYEPETPAGSKSEPILRNVVATVNLGCELDLKTIVKKARNCEYNPKRFGAVVMRIRQPKTTALIFSSGKMVVTGAKSELQARDAARKFTRIIQKIDFPARFTEFKIHNLVGSCDVGFQIRLEALVAKHYRFASYEPEIFPGLIYRVHKPKVVLLIFSSGKLVLTGAKKREDMVQAFHSIYPVLHEFKKKTSELIHH